MIASIPESMPQITNAMMMEAINTTTELLVSSARDGQDTLCTSSE
jgi:hypothetical protein